ncbi:hypothetical protein GC102_16605 [Paenibacillus sp. LMG 31460]|uniref:Uncharacterized protein n=1 Tax=Paenibacillus germinis TaxID=2654979 RepID=A0ABX1Z1W4_9BACL|nr:hypothetical protein [Paenibacillus germinis]NOU87392.1 hypothetical protein [Paenibacillus germinis]
MKYKLPDYMHEFLRNVGMILEEFNSDDSFELPSTATYIINQNCVITAGYADVDLKQANGSFGYNPRSAIVKIAYHDTGCRYYIVSP